VTPGSTLSGIDTPAEADSKFCLNADMTPLIEPSRPWRNPNPTSEPVYSNASKNIFMTLQNMPLNNYTNAPMKEIQFPETMHPPQVQSIDSLYLTYFVTEILQILGSERFIPSTITTILRENMNQPVLRHSIQAISSWITDSRQGRPPMYGTLQHLQRCLPGIQKAIADSKISPAHILAVSFLSWLGLMGDLHTTHRYLQDLFLMFVNMRHLSLLGQPYDNTDPNMMFLHRISIKIDNVLAYRNFPLAYPPLTSHGNYNQKWLRHFISNQSDIDNCIASFQLDDFTNQICHLHYATRELRRKRETLPTVDVTRQETEIQARAELISQEHKTWLLLPQIAPRIPVDKGFPVVGTQGEQTRFLHYPDYPITDTVLAEMLLIHASLGIHLSIVTTGKLGDYPRSRHDAAVQICRIYAALEVHSSMQKTRQRRLTNALWLAGLVLGNDCYPAGLNSRRPWDTDCLGYEWILRALLELEKDRGYRQASKLADALEEIWAHNGVVDAWDVVGRLFDTTLENDSEWFWYGGLNTWDKENEYRKPERSRFPNIFIGG
jgi:hypothetical protein